MDLHISVIADFKATHPDIEVIDWCLSGHAWVMKRQQDTPLFINPQTWMNINEDMIQKFQATYGSFLSTFDGFITGHVPAFAMIYEKYNKPIIMINSCRYDLPFCFTKNAVMRNKFHECITRIRDRLVIVSNNKGDQMYTHAGLGIFPRYIPSLCLYTRASYAPTKPTFLCYSGSTPVHPLITQKVQLPTPYEWTDIASYRGVIHFPYEISTMSMFEHFTAGCPMFFPSMTYLKANPALQTMGAYWGNNPPTELSKLTDLNLWIDNADMYSVFKSSNTYYFDSIEHLYSILESFEYVDDSDFRKKHIETVKQEWKTVLDGVFTKQ
jgi:hypothetical protein